MNLIAVIGRPQAGKSTFIKKFIENKKVLVFDVNNEYTFLTSDTSESRSRDIILNIYEFIQKAKSKINTVVVFEDATGFFRGFCRADIIQLIQQRAHANNTYIFCFHSLRSVPPSIIDFINYLVIFKTNDQDKDVLKKFPDVMYQFKEVKNSNNKHFYKILKLL